MIDTSFYVTEASIKAEATNSASVQKTMGKDEFLKLLVAQMQAQDPMDPMESADFSAQLAQFSALEQMQNVNSSIEDLIELQLVTNNNMAVALIDKAVSSPGDNVSIVNGKADPISYELASKAVSVTVNIFDSRNNLVSSHIRGTEGVGLHNFTWDGKDSSGKALPDGNYSFSVTALGNENSPVATRTHQSSRVSSIVFENGISYAITGNNKIDVKDISSVNSTL